MTKKTLTRLPAIACPDCGSRTIARSSEQITRTVRELRLNCDSDACGASYVAQIAFIRTVRASAHPHPEVRLPFSQAPRPANENNPAPANDDHGLGDILAKIMSG